MDYDDNDFQGQNLHIAGEGSSKFSPLLRPYALPKFDFDDGLQGHLRFDSLVENEVFLGIPSQEDNQWIEDFSRGSSGIEFSSSAAESCSISRRHNVWSEATSSESVEMLLKSVGQEEMVPGETITEEIGACEELGGLTEQMEPHLKQDDMVKNVMDSEAALPAAEFQEHCSRLNNVTGTSQTREAEMPAQGSLQDVDPNASSETCGVVVTDENQGDDRKCDNVNQTKVNTSVDESFGDKIPKDSSGSRVPTDDLDSSPQGIAASSQVLNIQDPEHLASDISFENANCLLTDTGKAVEEHRVCDKETDVDDQNLKGIAVETVTQNSENIPCPSEVEHVEGDAVESGISTFVEPSSLPPKGKSDLHMVEICSKSLCSIYPEKASNSEPVDFSNGTGIHQEFGGRKMHEALPLVYEGDSNLKGHAIEVSSMKTGFCASSELKIDPLMPGENRSVERKDPLQRSYRQGDSEALINNSGAPLLPGVDRKLFDGQGDGSSSNYVGDLLSGTVAHSSAELLGEKRAVENLKSADDTSTVHMEDTNKEGHASSPMEAGSMETENPNDRHYNEGVSFHEKQTAKLPCNSSNMDCEIVDSLSSGEMPESSSQGEAIKVNNEVVQGSECVTTTTGNEPALNVAFEKTNMALHGTVDGVPVVSETSATVDQVNDHANESRKTKDECLTEANLLPSKESLEGKSERGPVSKLRKGESGSSAGKLSHDDVEQSLPMMETCNSESGVEQSVKLLHKTVDHSLPMAETCNTASGSEQALKENEICQDSSCKFEVSHIPSDSAVKESNDAEGLVTGNHEEVAVVENHEVESSKVTGGGSSGYADKPNCETPAVTTCNVLCQSEKDEKMGLEGSVSKSLPFSELTAQASSQTVKGNDAAKDERSFNFDVHPSVGPSEERDTSKDRQSITAIQACKIPMIVEGSSTSGIGQMDPKLVVDLSCGSSQAPDGKIARGVSKGTPERRTRRGSGRAAGKDSAKKGNHMKEITAMRQTERGEKSRSASMNPSGTGLLVQFEGMKSYGNVERSGAIPCGVVSIPTSNLPDLNTKTLQSTLYQQPFTDLQQVQLRAQIFVYGSLIQGTAPDEACMVSAFGASDGGRSVWEPVWCACVERIQGQKSLPNKSETPPLPRPELRNAGAKPSDQSVKQGSHQSKVVPSPLGRASSKGTHSPVVNSVIPLSSPLWNASTPSDSLQSIGMPRSGLLDYHQTLPPLHPFQTPPARSFVGHTASWLSQAPFPGPWVASPQTSAFDGSARFSVLPMTETVKLTPVKESSVSVSSGSKLSSPSSVADSLGVGVLAGASSLPDMKKTAALPVQNSTDMKTRKRKKATVCEDLGHISFAQTLTEQVSAPIVTSHLSTSVVVSTPASFVSKDNARKIVTGTSPTSSSDIHERGEQNIEPKVITSEETINKVEEAKQEAEDAASLAAAAVSHSQSVWSQLDKQKYSGSILDVEARLSSAAAAVAAAASVAKAAAAAAKIASNAALQAKLMAEEALASSGASNPSQSKAASLPNVMTNLGKATSASILKGGDGSNCSSSIIVAAREAARRRVEAASAASKHAENLDAIVKAAELAAEAVSQVGKIVAMGEPLPLNELVEAGTEGYLRGLQVPSELGVKSNNDNREQSKVDSIKGLNIPGRYAKDGSSEEAKAGNCGLSPLTREVSLDTTGNHMTTLDSISISFTTGEKDSRGQKSRKASDLAKTIGVVPESEFGSRSGTTTAQEAYEKGIGTLKEHSIKEGCLVEVRKDGDAAKTAWFSANVLSLKDGKAFVCYTELQSDEGSGKLKEWVALEGEANNAPTIRIAHPVTTMRFEGTRKRRRAAMGDYVWSVGDRVDVRMDDCWREGVVTEKKKKDDTTLTVRFLAEGETAVVKTWHLRPTLIWKDGEWIEWLSSRQKDPSSQGDTPQEKRLKSGIPAIEGRDKDKMSKNIGPDQSRLLPLSTNEKVFNVGKNVGDENQSNALRTVRSGLQKEGSRVIFGVPKPGKKRKFMEVSKHYVDERSSKSNESSDSVKFAKYLMPRGSGSRGWKNSTKIDTKEKHAAESKNKVLKSGKAQTVSGRTLPQKSKLLTSAQSDGTAMDHMIHDSVKTDENASGQQSLMEFGSFSNNEGASEGPVLFSSLALPSDGPSKKISTSNPKSEPVNRGKLGPSSGKLAKAELKEKLNNDNPGKSVHEVEPRRSVRRIQPTSRLLEGLQSSLIISKIPAVSHDKSHRGQNRVTSKGNNNG